MPEDKKKRKGTPVRKKNSKAKPQGIAQDIPSTGEVPTAIDVADAIASPPEGEDSLYNINILPYSVVENNEDNINHSNSSLDKSHHDPIIQHNDESTSIRFEQPLTERETLLLELYFSGRADLGKAVKMAGYRTRGKSMREYIGRRVIEKLEQSTSGRDIFRKLGLGEVTIGLLLLQIASDPRAGANARIAALATASKCIGLQREVIEGSEGAEIVINMTPKGAGKQGACREMTASDRPGGPIKELAVVK
jgi:hypothetical protein